jgi:putative transposase
MTTDIANLLVGEGWRDGIEALVRGRMRGLIEEILEEELRDALGRERYVRLQTESDAAVDKSQGLGEEEAAAAATVKGHRNGRREREVTGTFGKVTIAVPRARLRQLGVTLGPFRCLDDGGQ